MKKKLLLLTLSMAICASLFSCSSDSGEPSKEPEETPSQPEQSEPMESQEPEENSGAIQSGTYTLPCGMKIQFYDSVRNDVTGNWRRATTSDSYVPADYALEYYNEMFSSDDEIHSIWNATLGTTTRISVTMGMLCVDTLEYVKGEEHDAKAMFSGTLLDSRIIDIETGSIIEE